jgi:hypothetical protein
MAIAALLSPERTGKQSVSKAIDKTPSLFSSVTDDGCSANCESPRADSLFAPSQSVTGVVEDNQEGRKARSGGRRRGL